METLVIAHSASAFDRGERLFRGFGNATLSHSGPGARGAWRALRAISRSQARVVYLIDVGMSTTIAAVGARLLRRRVVIDTGDLAYELARSIGSRSRVGLAAVWLGERVALSSASHVVVRGTEHLSHVRQPATFAPDLPPPSARPVPGHEARRTLGLEDAFVVGLVGSLNWAPRLETSYGWDLIEALPQTPPQVIALIIGDGSGRARLESRARALGVDQRCRFLGSVPSSDVVNWISAMDAAISTQTNDAVGAVRTTGKLPLYLACGCPVLASDVGEARRLLGPLGWTIRYDDVVDNEYPPRLAGAIRRWADNPEGDADRRRQALDIAATAFDVEAVRARVHAAIETLDPER